MKRPVKSGAEQVRRSRCGFCGGDTSNMDGAQFCSLHCQQAYDATRLGEDED